MQVESAMLGYDESGRASTCDRPRATHAPRRPRSRTNRVARPQAAWSSRHRSCRRTGQSVAPCAFADRSYALPGTDRNCSALSRADSCFRVRLRCVRAAHFCLGPPVLIEGSSDALMDGRATAHAMHLTLEFDELRNKPRGDLVLIANLIQ